MQFDNFGDNDDVNVDDDVDDEVDDEVDNNDDDDNDDSNDDCDSCFHLRGVHILKRPAQPGERPWECFKGTATINVPIHYILAYAFSLDLRGEYDDLYNTGIVNYF